MPNTIEKHLPRYENLRVTREEYLDLVEDGFRYDMIDGVLQMSPSPEFEHAKNGNKLNFKILQYLEKNPIAEVVMECDVLLPDGGDVLRPDIIVILNENMNKVKMHIHGAPDIVAEVLSPSTRNRDLGTKADRYLNCGVKEYWIVDPKEKSISVWRNEGTVWKKETGEVLQSNVLLGLEVRNKDIFD
jgi:Uma2 family endonuclease